MSRPGLIERAARAICVTFGYDPDKDDEVGIGETGDVNWNMFEDHARAVLAAIRDPSEAMVQAGDLRKEQDTDHWENYCYANPADIWRDMVDAALAKGTE
ncbi:hypothetical protein HY78_00865 [Rhizorhabdus wittichii DC-6]|nr:hypothetical protein HY78_00865 [Rhizorhabdus wittichii DC-6]